jgi:hypothetical protein
MYTYVIKFVRQMPRCQSGVAQMQPSERENHAHEGSDSSSN